MPKATESFEDDFDLFGAFGRFSAGALPVHQANKNFYRSLNFTVLLDFDEARQRVACAPENTQKRARCLKRQKTNYILL